MHASTGREPGVKRPADASEAASAQAHGEPSSNRQRRDSATAAAVGLLAAASVALAVSQIGSPSETTAATAAGGIDEADDQTQSTQGQATACLAADAAEARASEAALRGIGDMSLVEDMQRASRMTDPAFGAARASALREQLRRSRALEASMQSAVPDSAVTSSLDAPAAASEASMQSTVPDSAVHSSLNAPAAHSPSSSG